MTAGHCWSLRDHGTETEINFDCVTHGLKQIEKDYHRARGCVLSPHVLLSEMMNGFNVLARVLSKKEGFTMPSNTTAGCKGI